MQKFHVIFNKLFDEYHLKALSIAHYFVKSEFISQDIVSEVFLSIWKNIENISKIKNIESYLYILIKNKSLDYLRKAKKSKLIFPEKVIENPIIATPETKLMSNEFEQKVFKAIESLPTKTQLIYKMVKEDELKYKEVAQILDVSIKVVEYQMGKALKQLKEDLKGFINK